MVVMQGADTWFWFWMVILFTAASTLAVWYYIIIGRDRPIRKQRRGEETIERYGTIEEDRAPTPKFLLITYIGIAVWAVAYVIWTGIEGLGV
jgi:membrane protein implicated in regulation of membrane protease activity